jgi:small conductance mechanosensitive channel
MLSVFLTHNINSTRDAYDLLVEKLQSWLVAVIHHIPNLIVAILVLVTMFFIAKLFRKIARKVFTRVKNKTVENLLANIIFIVIFISGIFMALGVMNLNKTVTSLLAGAGLIGLALSFAFQDIAQNFISGISMALRRPFNIGDTVEVAGKRGVVKQLNLRTTELVNSSGEQLFIPNKEMFQNALINSSRGQVVQVRIVFGVPYREDLDEIQEVIVNALEKQTKILNNTVDLFFTEFTDANIRAEVRFYINRGENDSFIKSNAIKIIKKILDTLHEKNPVK